MTSFADLPVEIVMQILSILADDYCSSSLAALARTNFSIYELVKPYLFRTITLHDRNSRQLLKALLQDQTVPRLVRSLLVTRNVGAKTSQTGQHQQLGTNQAPWTNAEAKYLLGLCHIYFSECVDLTRSLLMEYDLSAISFAILSLLPNLRSFTMENLDEQCYITTFLTHVIQRFHALRPSSLLVHASSKANSSFLPPGLRNLSQFKVVFANNVDYISVSLDHMFQICHVCPDLTHFSATYGRRGTHFSHNLSFQHKLPLTHLDLHQCNVKSSHLTKIICACAALHTFNYEWAPVVFTRNIDTPIDPIQMDTVTALYKHRKTLKVLRVVHDMASASRNRDNITLRGGWNLSAFEELQSVCITETILLGQGFKAKTLSEILPLKIKFIRIDEEIGEDIHVPDPIWWEMLHEFQAIQLDVFTGLEEIIIRGEHMQKWLGGCKCGPSSTDDWHYH